ncbi:ATP-dependent RecD-like DNA helicase [uncultured Oscillibacter sp.]|uniref:SF1B family DNA helicase RecD2 n=1 Tax=uncultured Oscillibacter sp. TaxID=876091 RepID=UPI002633351C|nr:ATP-dependent RecD-like DNA helicase [uncultured Oscillibacter sp.]
MGFVAAFDKQIFFNESTRYTVLQMKTADIMVPQEARRPYKFSDHLIRFTAVGYDLPRNDSVEVELEGTWAKDAKCGLRFEVERWKEILPSTIKGIRAYLSSGVLKGIGEKTTDAIVNRFGDRTLEVLEHEPERLLEIRGITPERLEEIKANYTESQVMRELMLLLAPLKVTPNTAMKVLEHFGMKGVALIRESLFRLCEVPGFGFRRVDEIVRKSGGNLHDPMRVQGALFYIIQEARDKNGHLYIEIGRLLKDTLKLLNEDLNDPLRLEQVEQQLAAMINLNVVVSNGGNIYLPQVYKQECEVALKIAQMVLELPKPVNLTPVMEQVKGRLGITLSPQQAEGVEMAFRYNLSIITGGPGTGKSTILRAVVEAYRMLYPQGKIALAAPTGKASRRMAETTGIEDAQTLHSLLKLFGDDSGGEKKKQSLEAGLLIVDETSMVDMWLAHQLFRRLNPGTKVLLVGDADQLESVGAGNVFQELIDSGIVPVTVLDQIFRQAEGSRIAYNARFINEGNGELYYGPDFDFVSVADQEEAAETVCRLYKEAAARVGIQQLQILSPYREKGEASSQNLNKAIREEVNPEMDGKPEIIYGSRAFRLRDRVIQLKNNSKMVLYNRQGDIIGKGVFNGDVGYVREIRPDTVIINFDGRYAKYPLDNLEELELSYAMTIHKAMGSEYDTVIIPLLTAHRVLLTRNLLYTAVTRAKGRVILVGQKKALFTAVSKTRKGKRNTLLAERMRLYHSKLTVKSLSAAETPMRKAS